MSSSAPPDPGPSTPPLSGLHHVKLPVSSLPASLAFYTHILSAVHLPSYDHRPPSGTLYAHILRLAPSAPHARSHPVQPTTAPILLELRLAPAAARALAALHADVLTLSAPSEAAVDAWARWADAHGVRNSGKLRGLVGHLVVLEDPDGVRVRLYSTEMPEGGMDPALVSRDEEWVD